MITTQVRGVKNRKLLVVVLELLERCHNTGYEVHKPRASLTYNLKIEGEDEGAFLGDLKEVAEATGWRIA